MARSYAKIRLHKDWVYSTEEVLEKYDICANTLTNWIKQGLRRIETARPHLYRGAELIRFHQDRRARGRTQLRHGEFKCVGCKQVVLPEPAKVDVTPSTSSVSWTAITKCPDCSTLAWKILNATECDSLRALQARCLIPRFDGVILSKEWKDSLWDKFVMAAPRPRTPSEQQYSDRKLRSRS